MGAVDGDPTHKFFSTGYTKGTKKLITLGIIFKISLVFVYRMLIDEFLAHVPSLFVH